MTSEKYNQQGNAGGGLGGACSGHDFPWAEPVLGGALVGGAFLGGWAQVELALGGVFLAQGGAVCLGQSSDPSPKPSPRGLGLDGQRGQVAGDSETHVPLCAMRGGFAPSFFTSVGGSELLPLPRPGTLVGPAL